MRRALFLVLLVNGCAGSEAGRSPSLAPRAIESRSDAEPVTLPAVAEPDAALNAKIAAARVALAKARASFASDATAAERAARAARGSGVGDERWIAAQTALARLDALRGDSLGALSDLEALAIDRGTAGLPPYPALEAARDAGQAQLDAQVARIGAINAAIGTR